MRNVRSILSALIILGIGGLVLMVSMHKNTSWFLREETVDLTQSEDDRVAELRSHIREDGPREAFSSFARAMQPLSSKQQHPQAHLFGRALYEETGLEGFSVCDSQFSFGCFHEFIGLAIEERGPEVIRSLNEGCIQQGSGNLGCQHGIGHGVLAYAGYREKDLAEAVNLCRDLKQSDPIGGCYGGMYMEYNLHTMKGEDARSRPYAYADRFKPCSETSNLELRRSCLYWQPQWWNQAMSAPDSDESFEVMGRFCREAKELLGVDEECFRGIGNITSAAANFVPERTIELCKVATQSTQELLWCMSIVANHLNTEASPAAAESVCMIFESMSIERDTCLRWANNTFNIVNPQ